METEYRAWDKVDKRMIVNKQDFIPLIVTNKGVLKLSPFNKKNLWELADSKRFELSQYIGIKDIFNRKIFEGDIVRIERQIYTDCSRTEIDRINGFIGEIVKHQYSWCIAEKTEKGIKYHFLWTWNVKDDKQDPDTDFMGLLGNRWDNPDMAVIKE